MPTHDNEQANEQRRVVYSQNRDKNNKKQHLLYRAAQLPVEMSSLVSLLEPSNRPSVPPAMLNPSNTYLDDAHQQFHEKMDQLADLHVCIVCKECYPGIVTKKFHEAHLFTLYSRMKMASLFIGKQYGPEQPTNCHCSTYTG